MEEIDPKKFHSKSKKINFDFNARKKSLKRMMSRIKVEMIESDEQIKEI
jgi:hypothetical protein